MVKAGEPCPTCGEPLKIGRAIEVGHVFKLGTKYSVALDALFVDEAGQKQPLIMGCYGIGIERILTAAIEQNHDADGFWLPPSIAPFDVVVTPVNIKEEALMKTAEEIAQKLEKAGFSVLLDDRDERPGTGGRGVRSAGPRGARRRRADRRAQRVPLDSPDRRARGG